MQWQQSPDMVSVSMTAKDKICRLFTQRCNVAQPAVEQNRVGANLNAQTDPFIFVANTVGQAG